DGKSTRSARRKQSVAVLEAQLPVTLMRDAGSVQVDREQEIVLIAGDGTPRPSNLAQSAEIARHEAEACEGPFHDVDADRTIAQRLKWLDCARQHRPLMQLAHRH